MTDTAQEIAERRLRVWWAQLTRDLYGKRDDIDVLEKYVLDTLPDVLVEHGNARHKAGQEEMRSRGAAVAEGVREYHQNLLDDGATNESFKHHRDCACAIKAVIAALPVEKDKS